LLCQKKIEASGKPPTDLLLSNLNVSQTLTKTQNRFLQLQSITGESDAVLELKSGSWNPLTNIRWKSNYSKDFKGLYTLNNSTIQLSQGVYKFSLQLNSTIVAEEIFQNVLVQFSLGDVNASSPERIYIYNYKTNIPQTVLLNGVIVINQTTPVGLSVNPDSSFSINIQDVFLLLERL
jgi:hypothetical protein